MISLYVNDTEIATNNIQETNNNSWFLFALILDCGLVCQIRSLFGFQLISNIYLMPTKFRASRVECGEGQKNVGLTANRLSSLNISQCLYEYREQTNEKIKIT